MTIKPDVSPMYTPWMTGRHFAGSAMVLAGVTTGVLWGGGRVSQPFVPVAALLLFLAGASMFSRLNRLADSMHWLIGKKVSAQVWGSDLPGSSGSEFTLHSIKALGAALHVYLRPGEDAPSAHLKIAQPRGVTITDVAVEIVDAKYIQWAGRKINKPAGEKALVLRLSQTPDHS